MNHAGPARPDGRRRRSSRGVIEKEKPDLAILGKQSIDDDQNQTGQYLAEWLGWSQATFASKVESLESEAEKAKTPGTPGRPPTARPSRWCARWTAACPRWRVTLPAVVTTDLRLNQPRYASLPGIMKAKSKPIEELTPASARASTSALASGGAEALRAAAAQGRHQGRRRAGAVQKLKNEAKVI